MSDSCNSVTHSYFSSVIKIVTKIREWLETAFNILATVSAALAGICMSFTGEWWDKYKLVVTIGLLVLTIVFLVLAFKSKKKLQKTFQGYDEKIFKLESENRAYQQARSNDIRKIKPFFQKKGMDLLEQCNIQDSSTRISLYQHEPKHNCFILLARSSVSPALAEEGRQRYPDNQGIIGETWKTGKKSWASIYEIDPEKWAEKQKRKYNIPFEVALAIKMKSRTIGGVTLTNEDNKSVGILIIESTEKDAFTAEDVDTIFNHEAYKLLAAMLTVTPHLPDVQPDTSSDGP